MMVIGGIFESCVGEVLRSSFFWWIFEEIARLFVNCFHRFSLSTVISSNTVVSTAASSTIRVAKNRDKSSPTRQLRLT